LATVPPAGARPQLPRSSARCDYRLATAAYTSEPWAAGVFAALATVGASPRLV